MKLSLLFSAICISLLPLQQASASQLVYRGMNANITPGAPYNPAQAEIANRTRPYDPRSIQTPETDNEIARRNVISTATTQLTSACDSITPGCGGTVRLPDGSSIDYSTGLDSNGVNTRTVTFHNADGTTTEISFPI